MRAKAKVLHVIGFRWILDDYSHVHDQILQSLIVSNFTSTCSTLLHVPSKPTTNTHASIDELSTLISQHDDNSYPCKPGKECQKCKHYYKLGHKIVKCYALHGSPL